MKRSCSLRAAMGAHFPYTRMPNWRFSPTRFSIVYRHGDAYVARRSGLS